jgi:hypothetical protein
MSTTYRRRPHREATSAGSARAAGQTGHAGDEIACLDTLAAQMHARRWTAYINTPPRRPASLFVLGPHDPAECGDIFAAPDGITGEWWYWFSWAERIGPVHAPEAAADAIVVAFQRVCLTSVPSSETPL